MTPPVPFPTGDVWSRFSADPRSAPALRASDADRNVAVEALNAAFQDGRLDVVEHAERLEQALAAKRLAELAPLLADLSLAPAEPPRPASGTMRRIRDVGFAAWVALAALLNVIWLASWAFAGDGPYYYWPIWPMIGVGIPLLISVIFGTNSGGDPGSDPGGDDGHGAIEGPRDR